MSDDLIENVQQRRGLFRNVPRFLRRALERRLAQLEEDVVGFDRLALLHHSRLKRLHALLHLKPASDQVGALLFGKPPPGSLRAALGQLVRCQDSTRAAELVRQYRFPYLLVEAALGAVSAPVAMALIEVMDALELLARLPLLARRGLLSGLVRVAVLQRLSAIADEGRQRFPYQKIESLVRNAGFDPQLAEAAFRLVGTGQKVRSLIGHTALLVDASVSMPRVGSCLQLAVEVGWRLDLALAEQDRLDVYTFDTVARPWPMARTSGLDQWRNLLTVRAPAIVGTSVGAAIAKLTEEARPLTRLVIITDGYENRPPRLPSAFARYRQATGQRPMIHLVQPANTGLQLARDLRSSKVPFTVFNIDEHWLGMEALVPALAAQASQDRSAQILAMPE